MKVYQHFLLSTFQFEFNDDNRCHQRWMMERIILFIQIQMSNCNVITPKNVYQIMLIFYNFFKLCCFTKNFFKKTVLTKKNLSFLSNGTTYFYFFFLLLKINARNKKSKTEWWPNIFGLNQTPNLNIYGSDELSHSSLSG